MELTSGAASYFLIVGVILMALLWGVLLVPVWARAIKRSQESKKDWAFPLFAPAAITILAIAALIFIFIPQSKSINEENPDLHGAKEVREDFVESYEKEKADLQPTTKKELEADREKREAEKEALEKKKAEERDNNAAESRDSFRNKVMNRDQEN